MVLRREERRGEERREEKRREEKRTSNHIPLQTIRKILKERKRGTQLVSDDDDEDDDDSRRVFGSFSFFVFR
jgi:hypothetical protein